MKSKTQKKKELAELKDKLSKSKITIFTSFARAGEKGLKVSDIQALKKDLRAADSEYVVEKKTLLDKALVEDSKGDIDVFKYDGSLGVVFGYGEETAIAKSVYNFAKKNPALKYFGAIWSPSAGSGQGRFMDLPEFTEFAKLPTRDVMIARFLGMLNYPLSGLAAVLNQIAIKKGENVN